MQKHCNLITGGSHTDESHTAVSYTVGSQAGRRGDPIQQVLIQDVPIQHIPMQRFPTGVPLQGVPIQEGSHTGGGEGISYKGFHSWGSHTWGSHTRDPIYGGPIHGVSMQDSSHIQCTNTWIALLGIDSQPYRRFPCKGSSRGHAATVHQVNYKSLTSLKKQGTPSLIWTLNKIEENWNCVSVSHKKPQLNFLFDLQNQKLGESGHCN